MCKWSRPGQKHLKKETDACGQSVVWCWLSALVVYGFWSVVTKEPAKPRSQIRPFACVSPAVIAGTSNPQFFTSNQVRYPKWVTGFFCFYRISVHTLVSISVYIIHRIVWTVKYFQYKKLHKCVSWNLYTSHNTNNISKYPLDVLPQLCYNI